MSGIPQAADPIATSQRRVKKADIPRPHYSWNQTHSRDSQMVAFWPKAAFHPCRALQRWWSSEGQRGVRWSACL